MTKARWSGLAAAAAVRGGRLTDLARSASKSVATVLVVMPRVFAPQFVTYDLQFHRCLSLRIEIYGLTQSGGARRDKVTRASRLGLYARGYVLWLRARQDTRRVSFAS